VDRRHPPAHVVVVHDVVVDERERLYHLDADRRGEHVNRLAGDVGERAVVGRKRWGVGHRLGREEEYRRPEPLASGVEQVAGRPIEPLRMVDRELFTDPLVHELAPPAYRRVDALAYVVGHYGACDADR